MVTLSGTKRSFRMLTGTVATLGGHVGVGVGVNVGVLVLVGVLVFVDVGVKVGHGFSAKLSCWPLVRALAVLHEY